MYKQNTGRRTMVLGCSLFFLLQCCIGIVPTFASTKTLANETNNIMEQIPSFNNLIQKSIIDNWEKDALTDFKASTLQYHDVARKIEKLHIMFACSGIQQGDKIRLYKKEFEKTPKKSIKRYLYQNV